MDKMDKYGKQFTQYLYTVWRHVVCRFEFFATVVQGYKTKHRATLAYWGCCSCSMHQCITLSLYNITVLQ